MAIDPNSKTFLRFVPFTLPLALILPYAFVASRFRGLVWVWESGYRPFWITLTCLALLTIASSMLLTRLQRAGSTLYQVGVVLATVQTTYLAMSERRHSLLVLVFALFASQVLLSEKVKKVLRLPFFDSRRRWWEGYPKAIPGLQDQIMIPCLSSLFAPTRWQFSRIASRTLQLFWTVLFRSVNTHDEEMTSCGTAGKISRNRAATSRAHPHRGSFSPLHVIASVTQVFLARDATR